VTEPFRWVVVAFPEREEDRAKLRALLGKPGDPKLPAKYPGFVVLPCCACAMPLSVGPRSQKALASGSKLYCVWCGAKLGTPEAVVSLEPGLEDGVSSEQPVARAGSTGFIVVRADFSRQKEPGTGPYDYIILEGPDLTPYALTFAGLGVRTAKTLNSLLRQTPPAPIFAARYALVGDRIEPRGWIQEEATYRLAAIAWGAYRHVDVAWPEPADGWVRARLRAPDGAIENRYALLRGAILALENRDAWASWARFLQG
jgi:hypothetical protein